MLYYYIVIYYISKLIIMSQQIVTRNWALYNMAQTKEKLLFLRILNDAVDSMEIPYEYKGNGRPQIGLDDMLKCCVIKVFNNFSSRRTMAELQLAYALRYINQVPHFNSINNYMQKEELTPYLHQLYKIMALPLVDIENNFAVDATGFSTFTKKNWLEYRLEHKAYMDFKKLHIISGIRTNIITSAKVTVGKSADCPEFENLVKYTSENFRIREVCADAGYLSRKNCEVVAEVGGSPFILLRSNTRMQSIQKRRSGIAWKKMVLYYRENHELFLKHYHQRSNVESTFSMIKRKFLPYVRSKTDTAQNNEVLCKVVCHNASVLCNAMFEMDVNIEFDS